MPEDEILVLVKAWRKAHPRIVSMWYAIDDAAKNAIRFPSDMFEVNGLRFDVVNGWLRIRLPSGRYLSYPNARVGAPCVKCNGEGKHLETGVVNATKKVTCVDCEGTGKEHTQVCYDGTDQYTKRWGAINSYGGKFFENVVQATARDVFKFGLKHAEAANYAVVTEIHDELVCECPDDPRYTAEGLSAIMATNPPWAMGLPLAAAGSEMTRYAKAD